MSTGNQLGKYQPYPDYKDSGVEWLGEIPEHWVVNRIKNITEINPPKSEVRSLPSGMDVTFLPMEAIGEKGELDISRSKQLGEVLTGYTYVTEGDVMLAKITPCFENGKAAIAKGLLNGVAFATTEVIPLRCLDNADAKFLYYLVTSDPFKSIAEGSMYGAGGQKRVADSFVAEYHFYQPSTSERIKIAAFLDYETARIDQLIAKQQQLIELLKEKRQAVISHAVTKGLNPNAPMKDSGVEWLGQVPEHWVICKIKNLASVISKGTTPSTIGAEFIDEGVRFLKAENIGKSPSVNSDPEFFISEGTNKQISRSQLKENDVLVIIAGATTGAASILQKEMLPANTNQAVSFIRPVKRVFSKWMLSWLATDFSQRVIWMGAVQAAQPNLSMESLGNIPITLPPESEIQDIISTIDFKLNKFEQLTNKAEETISLMQERRTALISAAVTGKIDLRGWQPPKSEVAA